VIDAAEERARHAQAVIVSFVGDGCWPHNERERGELVVFNMGEMEDCSFHLCQLLAVLRAELVPFTKKIGIYEYENC
jgi:hypothetical protein